MRGAVTFRAEPSHLERPGIVGMVTVEPLG